MAQLFCVAVKLAIKSVTNGVPVEMRAPCSSECPWPIAVFAKAASS